MTTVPDMSDDQKAVEDFFVSTAAFDDGTRDVEVVTTHGAKIFLGKDDVYKIKRAVNLGYMDFTTLEQRKHVCNREIELNRDVAPSIYMDAVPITLSSDGVLAIAGDGRVVEWAVHMKRYPEKDVLANMARSGNISLQMASDLGEAVAKGHKSLKSVCESGGAERIKDVLDGLIGRLANRQLGLPPELVTAFKTRATDRYEELSAKLEERSAKGFVRRCHGDLHLANIVLLDGKPVPVDALEFNETFAETDVLYDLSFLIMDLLHCGLDTQANQVFNRYCLNAWSLIRKHGFEVFPFFMSLRSAVRAMVGAQRNALEDGEQLGPISEPVSYLQQAVDYLAPSQPMLIAVGGRSGTGKSTLAAELSPLLGGKYGALLLRSDLERKIHFNAAEFESLPVEAYSKTAGEEIYTKLLKKARTVLEQSQPVVLDAVFSRESQRRAAVDLAASLGVPFVGFWLHAPVKVVFDRVRQRTLDASDADEAVVKQQLRKFSGVRYRLHDGWHPLDASGKQEDTLNDAVTALRSQGMQCEKPLRSGRIIPV